MDADYDIFEIVNVIRDFWLIDAESYQRSYCTRTGLPLAPGYYVASWPEHIRVRRFNEDVAFQGPYAFRQEAREALKAMQQKRPVLSLGLSPDVSPTFSRRKFKGAASHGVQQVADTKNQQTISC